MTNARRRKGRPERRRRGFVLVIVLIVVVLLALGAYAFSSMMIAQREAVELAGRQAQTRMLVDSGCDTIRAVLALDRDAHTEIGGLYHNPLVWQGLLVRPDLEPALQGRVTVLSPATDEYGELAGLRFGLEDESARLNLNALILAEEQQEGAGKNMLLALPGMDEATAEAILDWLDEDDEPRELGAELDYYATLDPPYAPANGPIGSLEDLLLVRGVTPELLFGLDTNRNGLIDAHEQGTTQVDPLIARGWSAYLTLYSQEANTSRSGEPRIYLNGDDMQQLYDDLTLAFNEEWASFIVAYRQFGPAGQSSGSSGGGSRGGRGGSGSSDRRERGPARSSGSAGASSGGVQIGVDEPGEPAGGGQLDLSRRGRIKLTQVFDLFDVNVSVRYQGETQNRTVASPFRSDPVSLALTLPILLDRVTVSPAPVIPGRLNINQAPRALLLGTPGMTEEMVDQIIQLRNAEPPDELPNRRFETWLLVDGIVTMEQMRALSPFICAGGDVYRAQVVGYLEDGSAASRVEAVFDATADETRLLFWRELSHLGRGYALELLGVGDPAAGELQP